MMIDRFKNFLETDASKDDMFEGFEGGDNSFEDNFESLLKESLNLEKKVEGSVVKGRVVSIQNGVVVFDVGLKSEGLIPLKEFTSSEEDKDIKVGDEIDVYVERYENRKGEIVINREKARQRRRWAILNKKFEDGTNVKGTIISRVKAGYLADVEGTNAFLPASQIELQQVQKGGPEINEVQEFKIIKMNAERGNIVISRRAILEEERREAEDELFELLEEAKKEGRSVQLEGVVKNKSMFGIFIEFGDKGVSGLLHNADISWKRLGNSPEALNIGRKISVVVKSFDKERRRISLLPASMGGDPWKDIDKKYSIGQKVQGRVVNLPEYGAFVRLDEGVDALLHSSHMSWKNKNAKSKDLFTIGQAISVIILGIDSEDRKISVGHKECFKNIFDKFKEDHAVGSVLEGTIKQVTRFGVLVSIPVPLTEEEYPQYFDDEITVPSEEETQEERDQKVMVINGMAHNSDLSWDYSGALALKIFKDKIGEKISFKLLSVNSEKGIVKIGIKQLTKDVFSDKLENLRVGSVVECKVSGLLDDQELEVELPNGLKGTIRRNELSRTRYDQKVERFSEGETIEAKVTSIDPSRRRIHLSIKALEADEEKAAMKKLREEHSDQDSIGSMFGEAFNKAKGLGSDKDSL